MEQERSWSLKNMTPLISASKYVPLFCSVMPWLLLCYQHHNLYLGLLSKCIPVSQKSKNRNATNVFSLVLVLQRSISKQNPNHSMYYSLLKTKYFELFFRVVGKSNYELNYYTN